jgi:hypothetical protein
MVGQEVVVLRRDLRSALGLRLLAPCAVTVAHDHCQRSRRRG